MTRHNSPLGTVLTKQRAGLGLTMQAVAEPVGVTKAMILHWERGTKTPTPGNLSRLAAALELDFKDLFALAGYPAEGLPTLQPYLRTKYRDASQEALAEAEAFFAAWEEKHAPRGEEQA